MKILKIPFPYLTLILADFTFFLTPPPPTHTPATLSLLMMLTRLALRTRQPATSVVASTTRRSFASYFEVDNPYTGEVRKFPADTLAQVNSKINAAAVAVCRCLLLSLDAQHSPLCSTCSHIVFLAGTYVL
jgi:hypothetical protein